MVYHLATSEDDYYPYSFLTERSNDQRGPDAYLLSAYEAQGILKAIKQRTSLIGPTFKHEMTLYFVRNYYLCLGLAKNPSDDLMPWTTEQKIKDLRDLCDVGIGFLFEGEHYVSLLTNVFPTWHTFLASALYSSEFLPALQKLVKIMHRSGLQETTTLKDELLDILAKFFLKGSAVVVTSRSDWINSQLKKLCPCSAPVT